MKKIEEALLSAADLRPYYARAISALTPIAHESTPTIGVDTSWRLYYSPAWVESVSLSQLAGVIAGHEVEHLLRDHAGRRCDRGHSRWNIAGDLEINDDCDLELPAGGVYPAIFKLPDSLLAEEYFDQLPQNDSQCCGSGAGNPLPGELDPIDLGIDPAARAALVEAVRADVVAHEASAPGTVPAGIVMWAREKAAEVRLPWQRLLANCLRASLITAGKTDYSWSRLSRRASSVLRPGLVSYSPRVALIVDTSGSMSHLGAKTLGIVRDLLNRSRADVVCKIECDTVARRRRGRNWNGGGGTDLRAAFVALENVSRQATIVITDCETPWPEKPVKNTIVVSLTTSSGPPWARTIRSW